MVIEAAEGGAVAAAFFWQFHQLSYSTLHLTNKELALINIMSMKNIILLLMVCFMSIKSELSCIFRRRFQSVFLDHIITKE